MLEPHAAEVAHIVKACMENACSLSVPLVAHPRWGTKWGSMTPVQDVKRIKKIRVGGGGGGGSAAADAVAAAK